MVTRIGVERGVPARRRAAWASSRVCSGSVRLGSSKRASTPTWTCPGCVVIGLCQAGGLGAPVSQHPAHHRFNQSDPLPSRRRLGFSQDIRTHRRPLHEAVGADGEQSWDAVEGPVTRTPAAWACCHDSIRLQRSSRPLCYSLSTSCHSSGGSVCGRTPANDDAITDSTSIIATPRPS